MSKRIVLLEALATTPTDIIRFTRNLDDVSAAWRTDIAAWSCIDVVNHLIQIEKDYRERFRQVLRHDQNISVDDQPISPDGGPRQLIHDLVMTFGQERQKTMNELESATPAEWQFMASGAINGKITLRSLVQDLVYHDIEHINQIAEIVRARRLI
jgi:hypothetical protein